MSAYEVLIKDISETIGIELTPNKGAITLTIGEDTNVIVQESESAREVIVAIPVGHIGPGRFREIFLRAALKYNGHEKAIGSFGFSTLKDTIMLYQAYPLRLIKAKHLWPKIQALKDLAVMWQEGLMRGVAPTPEEIVNSPSLGGDGGGMFGL